MSRLPLLSLASAFVFLSTIAADAQGWSRSRTTIGPHGGVWSFNGGGSCAGGSCSSNQVWTGPGGRSVTRHGSTSCTYGYCEGTATFSGPSGGTVTRHRTFRRY